jgi:hypothetical protein
VLADIDLGDILWTLLLLYLMLMYFVVVVAVILDLFRSNDLSGWAKAVWAVALIVFPILAVVVYLVTRGDGIGQRNLDRAAADAERSASAPPPPPPPMAAASELEKAKVLLDAGAISPEEYDRLKTKLLA